MFSPPSSFAMLTDVAKQVAILQTFEKWACGRRRAPAYFAKISGKFHVWKPYLTRLGLDLNPYGSPLLARKGFGLGLGLKPVFSPIPFHARPEGPAQTHQGHMALALDFRQGLGNMPDVTAQHHLVCSLYVCFGEVEVFPF